ncbi:hypothetical protein DUI70_4055 [Streptomyces albus]|nr:hypothetical protein DUI70_4055 [Streptomyces albus]
MIFFPRRAGVPDSLLRCPRNVLRTCLRSPNGVRPVGRSECDIKGRSAG